MVVAGIKNYQMANTSLNFGAKTRSEREAERERAQERSYVAQLTADEIRMLQQAREKKKAKQDNLKKQQQIESDLQAQEKQYKEDVKYLKETQKTIKELTDSDKDKNILAGSTLKTIGKVADVTIAGVLSGMALHWSTGKAFMMLHACSKKPKISKFIGDVKRPFQIVGSSIGEGAKTAWNSMARKVKATEKGKNFVNSKPMKAVNEGLDEISKSYKNLKKDAKNITAEDVKSGIATVFGVSGFAAGVVGKLDTPEKTKG